MLAFAALVGGISLADDGRATAPAELGDRSAAMAALKRLKERIAQSGPAAAARALREGRAPFGDIDVALAINRVKGNQIYLEAHSMYRLIDGVEVTDRVDSQGRLFSQNLLEAAQSGGATATVTNRLSNAADQPVQMRCYAEWAPDYEGRYFVVACYRPNG